MADKELSNPEILCKIQQEIKVPKAQRNTFSDFDYRSNDDILTALKPIVAKYGWATQSTDRVETRGNHNYQVSHVALLNDHATVVIESEAWAREDESRKKMDAPQLSGSAASYASKRAWGNLLGIDNTKDSDATNVGEEVVPEPGRTLVNPLLQKPNIEVYANKTYHNTLLTNFKAINSRQEKVAALNHISHFITELNELKIPDYTKATLAALNSYFQLFLTTIHNQEMNKLQEENPDATQQQLFKKAEKAGLKPKMVSHTKIKEDKKESKQQEPKYVKADTSYI